MTEIERYKQRTKRANRKAWCDKRARYHEENRVKAKERKRANNQV